MRILVTDGMDKGAIEKVRAMGHELVEQFYEPDELGKALRDFDVAIIRSKTKLRAKQIDEAKGSRFKCVIRAGVGLDNIDVQYAKDNGIEVTSITGIGFNKVGEFGHPSKRHLYRNAMKLDTTGAEVFFLSCMGLATMELIPALEDDLGMPVITSHQASLWACLRHSGVNDKLPNLGKLFTI